MLYDIKKTYTEFDEYYGSYDPCTEKIVNGLNEIYEENKNISSYELKAKNIEYMCRNGLVKIFENSPFFFEFSSGRERHTWGGLQSEAGSFLHNKTADLWLNKYADDMAEDIKDGRIYCWNNPVGFDHFALGYDNILKKGFKGILAEAEEALKHTKKREFVKAMISSVKSLLYLAERFSNEAEKLAESAADEANEHYKKIAEAAANVPKNPPKNFYEAFAAIIFCRETIGSLEGIGISIYGHLDRMLEPYYTADVEKGLITYEEMKNLFHILFAYTDARFETKKYFYETSTTLVIGGCYADGSVCFNDITKAILETIIEGRYVNTKVNCRISSAHPKEYIEKIAEVQAANIPIIAIQNDETIISARMKYGYEESDARCYVSGGCHEIVVQDSEVCTRADTWINLPRLLLDVLENSKADRFDVFYEEVLYETKKYLLKVMSIKNKYETMWCRYDPLPLASATMNGCIGNGADITEGGTKYSSTELSLLAPATLIDSLTAVKTIVYDEKRFTPKEFYGICEKNFEGYEKLREYIVGTLPKYGTGNEDIDDFSAKVFKDIASLYRDENGNLYKNGRNGDYLPAFYPHDMFRTLGLKTIATPDGRKEHDYLSRGCSPSEFIISDNPAVILKSLKKADFTDYTDSFCAEITLPNMSEDKGINVISALIEIFLQNGGSTLQFNLFDREMLIEAQKNPESYMNICVRVCGYSAVFVTLGKEIQDEIISRAIR